MHQFERTKNKIKKQKQGIEKGMWRKNKTVRVWRVDYQRSEVWVRQDVAVVCDSEGVPVDSQLETQNETHEGDGCFFSTISKKNKNKRSVEKKKPHTQAFKVRAAEEQLIVPYVLG